MTGRFTTWGSVRGCCRHVHRTEKTAQACLDRDAEGCRSQGGYTDRGIRALAPKERAEDRYHGVGTPVERDPRPEWLR